MISKSKLPDIAIPKVPFSDYVLTRLDRFGSKTALIHTDNGDQRTFDGLAERTKRCATALSKSGLHKGDVVLILSRNRCEFVEVLVAIAACGATATTCNPMYTKDEITRHIKISPPKIVFTEARNVEILKQLSRMFPEIERIYTFGECKDADSYEDLISKGIANDLVPVDVDIYEDVVLLLSSSGTTGLPKSVMLTHHGLVSYIEIMGHHSGMSPKEKFLCTMPIFHSAGLTFTFSALCFGATVVTDYKFGAKNFLTTVGKHKITFTVLVPPMMLDVSNHDVEKYDVSSLKKIITGASSMSGHIAKKVELETCAKVFTSYGLTEGMPLTIALSTGYPRDSVGQLCANTQMKIMDKDGTLLGSNCIGEICAKGPQIMKGYLANPEATARTIDTDGWLHNGDLGKIDDKGFLYIEGRVKELIKYKANQVSPTEIEFVLLKHAKVLDVAVIGIPHPEAGEVPRAFVVRRHGSLTADDVHKYLRGKVSKYKYLRGGVSFVPKIPKSATGKILRHHLPLGGYAAL